MKDMQEFLVEYKLVDGERWTKDHIVQREDKSWRIIHADGTDTYRSEHWTPPSKWELLTYKAYYLQYCAEFGYDPLHEFSLSNRRVEQDRWQVRWSRWVGEGKLGLKVHAKNSIMGCWTAGRQLPKHVREFLRLTKRGYAQPSVDWDLLSRVNSIDWYVLTKTVAKGFVAVPNNKTRAHEDMKRQVKMLASIALEHMEELPDE